jgi:hypothetical protein
LRQFGLCTVEVALKRSDQLADIAAATGQSRPQLLLQIACGYTRVPADVLAQIAERVGCRVERLSESLDRRRFFERGRTR